MRFLCIVSSREETMHRYPHPLAKTLSRLDRPASLSQEISMPLPSDEKIVALGQDILKQFDAIFGLHPGFRPAHAKGFMVTGTFTPAPEAASFTRAPHITRSSTPVTVRFSNSTGIPLIPDTDPNASARSSVSITEHVHTTISRPLGGWPYQDAPGAGAAAGEFTTDAGQPSPSPIETSLAVVSAPGVDSSAPAFSPALPEKRISV
jgi:hypothetical protein